MHEAQATTEAATHLSTLLVLGMATILGYYAGQLARLARLPSLIGYMLLGILFGPSLFRLLRPEIMHDLSFITEISLAFVSFSIGAELNMASLKRLGIGIVAVILSTSFLCFFMVLGAVYALTKNLPLAFLFAAVAPASAPAGTVAVIQEYRAKGNLTKALYAVVGFDDGLAILIFGVAAALAKSRLLSLAEGSSESIFMAMRGPMLEIVLSTIVGVVIGFVFCYLVRKVHNHREILILAFGTMLITTGLCQQWHLSLILTNMVVGFVLVNTRRESLVHRVTSPLLDIMPLIFVLFFSLAGAHLDIRKLPALGLIGVIYILSRSAGKIIGVPAAALVSPVEDKIRKYLGMGLLSQAGVAIGLCLIVQHEFLELYQQHSDAFDRLRETMPGYDPREIGTSVITTITATCVFFEIVGPICTRIGLAKAGEIPPPDQRRPGSGRQPTGH